MGVFIGFSIFLLYVFFMVKVGELLLNQSMAVFVTGLIGYIVGVPLLILALFCEAAK